MVYTNITEFVLLGFPSLQKLSILLFTILLLMYILTITVNVVIITIVCRDQRLHTPMYAFLVNLSLLGICYTSVTVPKMMANTLSARKTISVVGCFVQCYCHFFLGVTEIYLLAAMSFDRYVAISKPLHYTMIMSASVCVQLALGSWAGGCLSVLIQGILIFQLPFCSSNIINHFFCDAIPLMKIACTNTEALQRLVFIMAGFMILGTFLFTFVTYVCIVVTVLRIPSVQGRWKTFSTCSSHLTVVLILYGAIVFTYTRPQSQSSMRVNKPVSVLNLLITPVLNPFIYTLRNKQVMESLRKLVTRKGKKG